MMPSKLTISALALASLVACGGGGGGTTAEAAPAQSIVSSIESADALDFGITHIPTETGYSGTRKVGVWVLANGDLNGDGYDDIVIGLNQFSDSTNNIGEIKPIVLIYDPASKKYKTDAQLQSVLPSNQMPRQAAIVDINGDRRMDLFIGDHGYDEAPYGGPNKLIINTATGYANRSDLLPQVWDYSHGLIVADFDNNGNKDLFVINNQTTNNLRCADYPSFTDCPSPMPTKEPNSYILYGPTLNKGFVSADTMTDLIPPAGNAQRLSVGTSADFNKDGIQDIVVANAQGIAIVESRAVGSYRTAQRVAIPSSFSSVCSQGGAYSYVLAGDLDNDGIDEVIGSYACNTPGWTDQKLQVIKRINGIWKDVTTQFIPAQESYAGKEGYWCFKLMFQDVNADGKKDIVCQSLAGFSNTTNNMFFMQQANGTFSYKDIQLKNRRNTNMHIIAKLGNESYILGFTPDYSKPPATMSDYIKIVGWRVPQ